MSFGYRDEDWVDPAPTKTVIVKCEDCDFWIPCPCGRATCGYGWCEDSGDFTERDDECEQEVSWR